MAMPINSQIQSGWGLAAPSQGVMVSPSRYVNLSGAPPTLEQRMRNDLDRAMRKAKFTHHALLCENLLVEALLNARQYRSQPHHSYHGKKVTRNSFGTLRPRDRAQELIRLYLIGIIWRVWMRGTLHKPIVNNRRDPDTPFVLFVKDVTAWYGLGNVIKNLERYQSYRRASLAGNSFAKWRQSKSSKLNNSKLKLELGEQHPSFIF
jgi:hypothetical protein